MTSTPRNDCWIGFGANLGDAAESFQLAFNKLTEDRNIEIVRSSHLYQTTPIGPGYATSQPVERVPEKSSNKASASESRRDRLARGTTRESGIIDSSVGSERWMADRDRPAPFESSQDLYWNAVVQIATSHLPNELLDVLQSVEVELGRVRTSRWGSRPIDLDLLYYGDQIIQSPRLTVPHPGAWYRRFVLDPMIEIAPDFIHPIFQLPIHQLKTLLEQRPLKLMVPFESHDFVGTLRSAIESRFPFVELVEFDSERTTLTPYLIFDLHERNRLPSPTSLVADLSMNPGSNAHTNLGILSAEDDRDEIPTSVWGDQSQKLLDFLTAALDTPICTALTLSRSSSRGAE